MSDPAGSNVDGPEHIPQPEQATGSPSRSGWPLWLRLTLAAVILCFVWSPFLAMLLRLSSVKPALQPTGNPPVLSPPPAPGAPNP